MNHLNTKYILFYTSLFSTYYIFLLFPPLKEITGALEVELIYLLTKSLMIVILLISITFLTGFKIQKENKSINIYVLYSLMQLLFLLFIMKYNIKYIVFSFYDSFGILFISILFFYVKAKYIPRVNRKKFTHLLFSIFTIILVYGYLQKIFNSPLLYYDFDFYYISSEIHKLRVFSLLPSRIQFAKLTALVASLMFFYILYSKSKYKIQYVLILILSLIGTYISTERTALVLFVVIAFNLLLLRYKFSFNKILFFNIIASFSLPFILASYTYTYSINDSLFRTNSLIDRLYWWGVIFNNYIYNDDFMNILFGYGFIQTTDDNSFSSVMTNGKLWIDNLYLTIFLYQGIFGLILFLSVYIKFILIMYRANYFYSKYFSIALVSWLVASVFARSIGDISLLTLLPAIIYYKYKQKKNINAE